MAVAHSRETLLAGDNTIVVQADLRDPDSILAHPDVRQLIDFDQPVALLLTAILHFFPDDQDLVGIVARFRDALPAGSHVAISHGAPGTSRSARPDPGGDGRDGGVSSGCTS